MAHWPLVLNESHECQMIHFQGQKFGLESGRQCGPIRDGGVCVCGGGLVLKGASLGEPSEAHGLLVL